MSDRNPITERYYRDRLLPALPRIRRLTRRGKSKIEICERLGLRYSTVLDYEKVYPDVREAFLTGFREKSDKVAVSLISAAIGYNYDETERIYDEHGDLVMRKVKTKYNPPNIGAINRIFKMFEQYHGVDERLKEAQIQNVLTDAAIKEAALKELQGDGQNAPIVELLKGLNTLGVRNNDTD